MDGNTVTVDTLTREQRKTLDELLTPDIVHALDRAARSRCYGTLESDEVLGKTLLRIARSIDTYRDDGNFKGWCMSVLYSSLKNELQHRSMVTRNYGDRVPFPESMHEGWDEDIADPTCDTEYQVTDMQHVSDTMTLIFDTLPQDQATALLMFSEGYTYKEIAQAHGVSVGTVCSRAKRARTKAQVILSAAR